MKFGNYVKNLFGKQLTHRPGAMWRIYLPQWTGSTFVQVMACHMCNYPIRCWHIIHWTKVKFQWKYHDFFSRKCIWKYCLQYGSHFVPASMLLTHKQRETCGCVISTVAKAPGHQYPQCWLYFSLYCPFSYTNITFTINKLQYRNIKLHFNSLWPSDPRWRQRSGSTLAQIMACCLTAPSHYLNQCWLIISEVRWHIRAISWQMPQPSITKICLKITWLKFHSNLPGANELNIITQLFKG